MRMKCEKCGSYTARGPGGRIARWEASKDGYVKGRGEILGEPPVGRAVGVSGVHVGAIVEAVLGGSPWYDSAGSRWEDVSECESYSYSSMASRNLRAEGGEGRAYDGAPEATVDLTS
jgi:hypothetical protein